MYGFSGTGGEGGRGGVHVSLVSSNWHVGSLHLMYIGLIFNPLHTHHRLFPQHLLCQLSEQWANHWFTGKHYHQIYLISSRTILPTALITGKRRRRPAVALFGGGGGSRSICLLFLHQGIISIRLTSKFSLSPRQRENKSDFGSPKTIPDENRFPKVGTGEFLFPPRFWSKLPHGVMDIPWSSLCQSFQAWCLWFEMVLVSFGLWAKEEWQNYQKLEREIRLQCKYPWW